MELIVLPIIAIAGLLFSLDLGLGFNLLGGGGDDGEDSGDSGDNPDLNRQNFGETDDTTSGTDVVDYLFMNGGDDMASGGLGDDRIFMGAGQDETVALEDDGSFDTAGMEGDDLIRGGEGRDILVDALGSNTIHGDTGYDRINVVDDAASPDTPDEVFGGFGNDTMFIDAGDTATGGGGDDRFQILSDGTGDVVTITDFEEGDTLLIRDPEDGLFEQERITTGPNSDGSGTNVMVDGATVAELVGVTAMPDDAIANPPARPMFGERELDADGEVILNEDGSTFNDSFNDDIVINDYATAVYGFGGDDTIAFAEDADTTNRDMVIRGGDGNDSITSGDGDDSLYGDLGNDTIVSEGGSDEVYGGFGDDFIDVGYFDQDQTPDTVFGGAGDDRIAGNDGDVLLGDDGDDRFYVFPVPTNSTSSADEPVRIGDFDPENEIVEIQITLEERGAEPEFSYQADPDQDATLVFVEGVHTVTIIGVAPTDLNDTNMIFYNTNAFD